MLAHDAKPGASPGPSFASFLIDRDRLGLSPPARRRGRDKSALWADRFVWPKPVRRPRAPAGDDSASGRRQRFAIIGPHWRVLAQQAQSFTIALARLFEPRKTHIDRRDDLKAAPVVGIGDQMRLDFGEQAAVLSEIGARGSAGPADWAAKPRIEAERDRENDDEDDRTAARRRANSRPAPVAGAALAASLAAMSRRAASARAPAASPGGNCPRSTSRSISASCALWKAMARACPCGSDRRRISGQSGINGGAGH